MGNLILQISPWAQICKCYIEGSGKFFILAKLCGPQNSQIKSGPSCLLVVL